MQQILDGEITEEEAGQRRVSKSAWRKQKGSQSKEHAEMERRIMDGDFDPDAAGAAPIPEEAASEEEMMRRIMDGEGP